MTKTIIVDANVIIRFLLNDHPRLSPIATSLFYKAQKKLINVYLDEVILAEVIWTLSSFYKIKKADLIENIEKFLSQDWVVSKKKDLIFKLETFDRNLKRLT